MIRRHRAPASSRILEYRPHASYTGYWNFDGFQETGRLHVDSSIIWKNGTELHTAVNFTHEGVLEPFDIVRGVTVDPGEYDHEELSVFFNTDRSAPFTFATGLVAGGFFGGDRFSISPTVTYRHRERFKTELSWNHTDVDLPSGSFTINLTSLRLTYSFTPKISVQALIQYNERDELVSTNFRFAWLQSANAGLYLVYNEVEDELNFAGRPRQELILKYSRIFDVF